MIGFWISSLIIGTPAWCTSRSSRTEKNYMQL
jgi:hypothetical protein